MESKIETAADFPRLSREAIYKADRIKAILKGTATFKSCGEVLLAFDGVSSALSFDAS